MSFAHRFTKYYQAIFGTLFFCFFIQVPNLSAQDLLHTARTLFFNPDRISNRRIGVEIEFSGLPHPQIEKILIEKMHATVKERFENHEVLFETPYGDVRLKIEGQAWRYEDDAERFKAQSLIDFKTAPREIVFPPMFYKDVTILESVARTLEKNGATGTYPKSFVVEKETPQAVSIQVNIEMPSLSHQKNVDDLVALMRVYFLDEHSKQIQTRLQVPEIRQEYLYALSPGFLRKLYSTKYRPTARELFDDYLYRQSAEFLGLSLKNAWELPIQNVQNWLLSQNDAVVSRVVKTVKLRISSLLIETFPNDPLSKAIVQTGWARPMPVIEFREANNDFRIQEKVEQTLGLVTSCEIFGAYQHDNLVAKLTGLSINDIERLRRTTPKSLDASDLKIYRYRLAKPREDKNPSTDKEVNKNKTVHWLVVSPSHPGIVPLKLSPNTLVFHLPNIHRSTILGEYNPGLENVLIQKAMKNKIFESKLIKKYVRAFANGLQTTVMPRTLTFRELMAKKSLKNKDLNLAELLKRLSHEFSQGWVMKNAWDLSTEKIVLTDQLNFRDEDPELIPELMIAKLKKPEQLFFQERVQIKTELRIEAIGGEVLSNGSIIERSAYLNEKKSKPVSEKTIRDAENFVRNVLKQLPEELRYLPYGFDVALLEDQHFVLLETNPGGDSSFLEENEKSSEALEAYLRRYPKLLRSGKIKTLSQQEQINWLMAEFKSLNMNIEENYPGFGLCESLLLKK